MQGYDYAQNGAYFITVCTQDRAKILSTICHPLTKLDSPQVKLTSIGQIVDDAIHNITQIYPATSVFNYVIMPNHVHLILSLWGDNPLSAAPTISAVIGNMKRFVSMQCAAPVWQKSFYDHVIRDEKDYHRIAQYVENNPATWENDRFFN